MKRAAGFSLLELMVVLLILAAISSAVAISAGSTSSPEKRIDSVGKALFAQMQFALDEALIQQQLIGLRIDVEGEIATAYSWHAYQNSHQNNRQNSYQENNQNRESSNTWKTLDSDALSTVSLADEFFIDATIDDVLLEALTELSLNDESEEIPTPPSIIFYPNGEISEFSLTFAFVDKNESDASFRIFIDERGQLSNSIIESQQ
ncbi:general secretion pathway protein H [gamma proteobacterium IMCC1989]|nr:general secretion pathway protein H [gamma proteobacterium IMCC1989]